MVVLIGWLCLPVVLTTPGFGQLAWPGKRFEVKVTPALTAKPGNVTLAVQTDYPPERPDVYHAFVQVK